MYKKGDKSDPLIYRLISMLTSFSKVLEKALYRRLIDHIDNNNILSEQQFGFRKRLSTEDAIFKLIHEFLNALNNKTMIGSIFCDLEKSLTFDKKTFLLWYKGQS